MLELHNNSEHSHVCVWTDGKVFDPQYVNNRFTKILKKHGLPKIRFPDLRHTAASLLLGSGLSPKQIQAYLGHEKFSTTLDLYGHLSLEGKREAAQVMSTMLR